MSIEVTKNGIIKLIQGDSGSIVVDCIPTDKNYEVYLAIRKKDGSLAIPELKLDSNSSEFVIFEITKEITEQLEVPKNVMCQLYYWGVKICDPDTGFEDTMQVGECCCCAGYLGKKSRIYVYPKIVEGITDESET